LVVLLLFEDSEEGEELSLQDIKSATQIPDADLCRALQSLACGKYRILTKNPRSRDVNPNDKFSFNVGFTCPLAKIKIQTIIGKVESGAERTETQERVDEERRHQIEVGGWWTVRGRVSDVADGAVLFFDAVTRPASSVS